ncbi:uncharacterized protein LOC132738660, partial [Ruditapes philippinarum]|uniref:uncharacterized protein LOC132738660 n=1 Tax=Ruditapes philippinarum TaxID=129788 RepID=UPI00295C0688
MDRLLAFLRRIFGMQDGEAGNHSQNKHDEKKEPNEVQKEKMLTEENEYYLRIILLLCGGCLYVTKRFLEQELKNRDEKLDNLLKRKEKKLRHELHKKQVERLFPNDGFDKTDIDTWDIQMILCVLVHVLNEPDSKEKKLIRELKKYRNDIIAHRATTTLNKKDFDTLQSDIQDTMKHLASKCSSSVQKDCEMYISSSLTGPLDISLAEKYLQELAESEEKVQEIIDKFKSLKRRISRSDVTTWHELNEIHCDLKELKSYFKTASMELENQIGVSNEGLNQLEDSLASKFRAHNQKEDPVVRKSVVPRELAKSGQSTSIPQTPQIEKNTSLSPESKSVKDQKPFVETPSKSPESKSVNEQKPFVETPSKYPESKTVKEQKPFVEAPSKYTESKSVKEQKPFVETPSKSPESKYVKEQKPFVETPSIGRICIQRDGICPEDNVAAIDIGTSLSGCAYYCREGIHIPSWWGGDALGRRQKTPTCILFDSNEVFHSFGFEAEDNYASLPEETNDYMNWFFFKHFKMQLYVNMPVKRTFRFVTVDGKEMNAMKVMSATIGYLRAKVLEEPADISRWTRMHNIGEKQISWILTVPAIWSDSAKQFMRESAEMAGIQRSQLTIALEPEVAGIYCIGGNLYGCTQSVLAAFGHKYIVVDMG